MKMENEIRRGDAYWIRMDHGVGSEEGSYRPIVVVSSDEGNESSKTLLGVFLTTKPKYGRINVPLYLEGKSNWAMGNQIVTVDKARLSRFMGSVTDDELYEIDEALRVALDLNYYDDEEETEDSEEEQEEGPNLEEKIADLELELKITKAAYDRLLEKVVEMRVDADIASAKPEPKKVEVAEPPKVEPPVVVAPVVKTPPKPEPKIDVNTATETALKKIGWDSVSAKAILANRPFETLEDLKSLPGVTKTLFNLVSPRMECVRVVKEEKLVLAEKVNINTWSMDQIADALGCMKTNAGQIVAHRTKYGDFTDVNELYGVAGLSKSFVDKHIEYFTVGEKVAPVETATVEKANVNTMSGTQIARILGCSKAYGSYFVTYRRRNGNYSSLEELYNVRPISKQFIDKHWEKFEL